MSDKRYTKVEQEIIQILDQIEKEVPSKSRPQLRLLPTRRRRRFRPRMPRIRSFSRPSWFWLGLAFGVALLAILASDFSHTLAVLLAIGSIGAFIAPIFLRRTPSASDTGLYETKTWRGRDISFRPSDDESPITRVRRWLDGRRGGPRF